MLRIICIIILFHVINCEKQKIFHNYRNGKKLNATATMVTRKSSEYSCLASCLYVDFCHVLNVEKLETDHFRCYLFITGCDIIDYANEIGFINSPSFKFFYTKRSDCSSIFVSEISIPGICKIAPWRDELIEAYCIGSWTQIQKRTVSDANFTRKWVEYENGFGDIRESHWLGNKNIHRLTGKCNSKLSINLTDINNQTTSELYKKFSIDSGSRKYNLTIGGHVHGTQNMLLCNGQDFHI